MKIRLIFPLLFLLFSCNEPKVALSDESGALHFERSGSYGTILMDIVSGSFRFTDIITLSLRSDLNDAFLDKKSLPRKGDRLGDFEVFSITKTSEETIELKVAPLKTGDITLSLVLEIQGPLGAEVFSFSDIPISIKSSLLNDSQTPWGLIMPEEERTISKSVFIPVSMVILLVTVLIIYLIRRKKTDVLEEETDLSEIIDRLETLSGKEADRENYQALWKLMKSGMEVKLSLNLSPGDPVVLKDMVPEEMKSLLDRMEQILFSRPESKVEAEDFHQDCRLVQNYLMISEKEEGKNVPV